MSDANPTVIVLGGVNGAGKTTASRALLANTLKVLTFVNADVIAQGLSGFDPDAAAIRAGRIMLEQLQELAEQRANFAFETTLAGRGYAKWLNGLRESGYDVHLFYFWLSSADVAIARVAARVSKGGHHIPDATVRRRYARSISNFFAVYLPVVNSWRVYDNTLEGMPLLVAEGVRGGSEIIYQPEIWSRVKGGVDG